MTANGDHLISGPKLHVGTYARNGGAGLVPVYRAPPGGWTSEPPYREANNASFGVYSPRHGLHYFVDEEGGTLNVLRSGEAGWDYLGRVGTKGTQPCYVALDADEGCIAIANYGSGSICLYRLDSRTGLPLAPAEVREHHGSGPVAERQDQAHAHCACFCPDRRRLFHVDLGADVILQYPFDSRSFTLGEGTVTYAAPAGSGPRHLVFHLYQPRALLLSELASTLTIFDVSEDGLVPRDIVSTLPVDFTGESLGGHLALNAIGDRVYVTNRGHDSVAVFSWDAAGELALLQHVPSGGKSPRAFALMEAFRCLVLANEESGTLTFFDVEPDGTLSGGVAPLPLPGAVFVAPAGHGPAVPDPQ
jgi:6-phosphogluconolactonase